MGWSRPMALVRQARAALWSVPVGLQLSILYTLLFAATLSLLGVVLYTLVDGFLVQDTAQRLENTTKALVERPQYLGRGRGGLGGPPPPPLRAHPGRRRGGAAPRD